MMTDQRIFFLAALAVLMVVCFLSDNIASLLLRDKQEERIKRLSLIIKGGVLAVAFVIFLIVFI